MQRALSVNMMKEKKLVFFCCLICWFFFPKYNQLYNFALRKAEEEQRNDWRLVFKAGMGFNFGDDDI